MSELEDTVRKDEIMVRQEDGQTFVIKLEAKTSSPLDVEGVNLDLAADEIVLFIYTQETLYSRTPN
jgi:hypothetical protein